jgi:glucose/arabinose dehydrogenase
MRKTLITAVVASAALAAVAATVPADATGHAAHRPAASKAGFKKVATGLNNPRQLNFSKSGKLYIAEAGSGGTSDCRTGAEGGPVCWGPSGSVTVVSKGHQHRLIKGLPSYADQGAGTSALGPADVVPYGKGKVAVSIGYGFDPADRGSLASPGSRFAELVGFNRSTHKLRTLGDLGRFEHRKNPIHDPNTDPTGVFRWGRSFLATDSGGNDVVKVKHHRVRLVKVFHDVTTTAGKVQAVPTDVVVGPDGAIYMCELTGFPFVKGAASIYRMVPGHRAKVYASGLTNVTSMAFAKDGRLYAVQISNKGLLNGPTGSLWRVHPDSSGRSSKNLTGPLFAPYGVAIKGHNAYVTTGAVAPGAGQVIKVPLG